MKFFSRKALVAGATAIAVSFAGVNVASAAPQTQILAAENGNGTGKDNVKPSVSSGSSVQQDDGTEKLDLVAIKSWIGIVTAVVSALTAIYAFVNKISK